MHFNGFNKTDFEAMEKGGLGSRMSAIQSLIQPEFSSLADIFVPFLSEIIGQDFYPHIARHLRRTVNPPDSTWIAFSCDRRSYKKYPHFQFGIWRTHLFFWLAFIEEYPAKKQLSSELQAHTREIFKQIPEDFAWSGDHMSPTFMSQSEMDIEDLRQMFIRLGQFKKSELLCGITVPEDDPLAGNGEVLAEYLKQKTEFLLPLYWKGIQSMEKGL